jgi:hypothetical protein
MKIIYLLSFIFIFPLSGKAQEYCLVNFDLGPEFHINEFIHSTLFFGAKARVNFKGLETYGSISMPISSFGAPEIHVSDEMEIIPFEGLYTFKPVIGLGLHYAPPFKYVSPYFGLGVSFFPSYRYDADPEPNFFFYKENASSSSFYISLGYRLKNISSYVQYYFGESEESLRPMISLGIQYSIGLTNTKIVQEKFEPMDIRRDLNEVIGRIDFSAGGRLGFSRGENVMAFGATAGLMGKIKGNHFLGFQFEYAGSSLAISNNYIENSTPLPGSPGKYYVEGNKVQEFKAYSLYYIRRKVLGEKSDFFYGGGISYYNRDLFRIGLIESVGPMLIAKLRSGMFHTSIQTQFPVSNFPFYLGIHFGTGFNLKSRKETD